MARMEYPPLDKKSFYALQSRIQVPVRAIGSFLKPLPEDPLFFLASATGETTAPRPFYTWILWVIKCCSEYYSRYRVL